jgi:hypothetical protein
MQRPDTNQTHREVLEQPRRQERRWLILQVALVVSLLLHMVTIGWLVGVRSALRAELDTLATAVVSAKQEKLRYDFRIDQTLPIRLDVPVDQSIEVPIQTEVRIKQQVDLPISTSLGTFNIPIPLDVTVPVSTTVPIEFHRTIPISTSVPIKFDVPIELDLGSPEFASYLDRLHDALLTMRARW